MSQYPIPPPSYGSTSPSPKSPNSPFYSGVSYHDEPGSSAGGIYNQPAPGDLPDDFKVGSLLHSLDASLILWIVWCLCYGELR